MQTIFSRFVSKSFSEILHEISLGVSNAIIFHGFVPVGQVPFRCFGRTSPPTHKLQRFADALDINASEITRVTAYMCMRTAYVYLSHRLVRDNQIRTHSFIQIFDRTKVNRELWYDWKRKREEKLLVKRKTEKGYNDSNFLTIVLFSDKMTLKVNVIYM